MTAWDEIVPTTALHPHVPMTKKLALLSVLLFAVGAPSAEAQRQRGGSRPIEFGIDGGILFGLDDPNVTVVALPIQVFRVGFLMTEKVSIEPTMALTSVRASGASFTDYTFGVGLLYSPGGDRVGNGLYGRPFVGLSGESSSGPNDDSNAFIGLGVGLKIPFVDRRLATRMEANYSHAFSDPGTNAIGLMIGLSFFTR